MEIGEEAIYIEWNTKQESGIPAPVEKDLDIHLERVSAPQIPSLAKGTVLPANKPFLAVLGDQRNGTNIEAPLSTIQEAVAEVMDGYLSANMAGHEATVSVLREILEAVLGIQIGDDVIAQAAERHNRKMNIARGGAV